MVNKIDDGNKSLIMFHADMLETMDKSVTDMGDEFLWDKWVTYGLPDEADEDEINEIAQDTEEFIRITNVYLDILKEFCGESK